MSIRSGFDLCRYTTVALYFSRRSSLIRSGVMARPLPGEWRWPRPPALPVRGGTFGRLHVLFSVVHRLDGAEGSCRSLQGEEVSRKAAKAQRRPQEEGTTDDTDDTDRRQKR